MARYKYATSVDSARQAKAISPSQAISPKHAIEIANWIRGRNTQVAKRMLEGVLAYKEAVPFKRFNWKIGHRTAIGSGRYPQKATKIMLKLVNEVEANASTQGLGDSLKIAAIVINRAATSIHHGRQRGRSTKATHIEIVVEEDTSAPKLKKTAKPKRTDAKPVAKQQKAQEKGAAEEKPAVEKKEASEQTAKPADTAKTKESKQEAPTAQKEKKSPVAESQDASEKGQASAEEKTKAESSKQ